MEYAHLMLTKRHTADQKSVCTLVNLFFMQGLRKSRKSPSPFSNARIFWASFRSFWVVFEIGNYAETWQRWLYNIFDPCSAPRVMWKLLQQYAQEMQWIHLQGHWDYTSPWTDIHPQIGLSLLGLKMLIGTLIWFFCWHCPVCLVI